MCDARVVEPWLVAIVGVIACAAAVSSLRSQNNALEGLAIARQIIDQHGGTIEATSPGPGFGSTFTVRIPLVEVRGAESGAKGPEGPESVPFPGARAA